MIFFDARGSLYDSYIWSIIPVNIPYAEYPPVYLTGDFVSWLPPCPPATCDQPCPDPYIFRVTVEAYALSGYRESMEWEIKVWAPLCPL